MIKLKKPIKIKLFKGHKEEEVIHDVETFINDPAIKIVDIQFSIAQWEPNVVNGQVISYTVFYRERAEEDEHPTTDILQ